jgi:hypothetical protein
MIQQKFTLMHIQPEVKHPIDDTYNRDNRVYR